MAGSGNEATKRVHTAGILGSNEVHIELAVADYGTGLNIQLWKSYSDQFTITLIHPNGNRREVIAPVPGSSQFQMENTTDL